VRQLPEVSDRMLIEQGTMLYSNMLCLLALLLA
jgi:hypothetical protein